MARWAPRCHDRKPASELDSIKSGSFFRGTTGLVLCMVPFRGTIGFRKDPFRGTIGFYIGVMDG